MVLERLYQAPTFTSIFTNTAYLVLDGSKTGPALSENDRAGLLFALTQYAIRNTQFYSIGILIPCFLANSIASG